MGSLQSQHTVTLTCNWFAARKLATCISRVQHTVHSLDQLIELIASLIKSQLTATARRQRVQSGERKLSEPLP